MGKTVFGLELFGDAGFSRVGQEADSAYKILLNCSQPSVWHLKRPMCVQYKEYSVWLAHQSHFDCNRGKKTLANHLLFFYPTVSFHLCSNRVATQKKVPSQKGEVIYREETLTE